MISNICRSVIVLSLLGIGSAIAAERKPVHNTDIGYGKATVPPKELAKSSCAAYGPGFKAVSGTSSCVRVFGGVRAEVGGRFVAR